MSRNTILAQAEMKFLHLQKYDSHLCEPVGELTPSATKLHESISVFEQPCLVQLAEWKCNRISGRGRLCIQFSYLVKK